MHDYAKSVSAFLLVLLLVLSSCRQDDSVEVSITMKKGFMESGRFRPALLSGWLRNEVEVMRSGSTGYESYAIPEILGEGETRTLRLPRRLTKAGLPLALRARSRFSGWVYLQHRPILASAKRIAVTLQDDGSISIQSEP